MSGGLSDANRAKRDVVKRPPSESSRFHASKLAVDRDVLTYGTMSELRRVEFLARCRWGSKDLVVCPFCNTGTRHAFREHDLRWKCAACDKAFSVTTDTLFSHHKVALKHLLAQTHNFACGASGQPALETRRHYGLVSYNGPFIHAMKLREGLARARNIGLVSGVIELDGSHVSGKNSVKRRGKPQNFRESNASTPNAEENKQDSETAATDEPTSTDAATHETAASSTDSATPFDSSKLTGVSRQKAAMAAKKAGETVNSEGRGFGFQYHEDRRNAFVLRSRAMEKGKGALQTRVGVAMSESPGAIQALVDDFLVPPETILSTDTTSAVGKVKGQFKLHLAVNHSETLVGPEGEHINNAEAFFARLDRAEGGIYRKLMPKYLHEYLCELAFQEDYRRLAPGQKTEHLLFYAMNVGRSKYWVGFTKGEHRDFEVGVPTNRTAKPSGPPKRLERLPDAWMRPPR